jgi:hypothetical protein
MKLALRRGHLPNANLFEKVASKVIERRLVTKWPHAGIVVGEYLYHSSAKGGLKKEIFVNNGNWDLFDCGDEYDNRTIEQFNSRLLKANGKVRYDWFSLLAYTPAIYISKVFGNEIRYNKWLYCYEWCYEVLAQKSTKSHVTPEDLLELYIVLYEK